MNQDHEEINDGPRFAEVALVEAEVALANGDKLGARAYLSSAMQHGSAVDAARAQIELARLEAECGEFDAARKLLSASEKFAMTTRSAEFLLDLAAAWRLVNEPASALRMYLRVLDSLGVSPRNTPSTMPTAMGQTLSPDDRFVVAFTCFQAATLAAACDLGLDDEPLLELASVQGDPRVSPFAALSLAQREGRLGERPAREEWLLRDAIEYDHPEASPHATFELARLLARREQYEEATRYLQQIRDDSGNATWAQNAEHVLGKGVADRAWAWERVPDTVVARSAFAAPVERDHPHRVLIVGAGTGGQYLFESLQLHESQRQRYDVIGFIDDHAYPGGVPHAAGRSVLGTTGTIGDVLRDPDTRPDLVWLAMPTVVPSIKRKVALACAAECLPIQTLPSMHELIPENRLIAQLRDLRIEDLIGERWTDGESPRGERAITLDRSAGSWLRASRVLIVGAGTIGTQLARKAADAGAERIVVVDHSDSSRARIEDELEARGFGALYTHYGIGIDGELLLDYAKRHECDVVFYTASGWPDAGTDPVRRRRVIKGLLRLVEGLSEAPRIERFVWVSDANVAVADTPRRALQAVAEAIAVGPLDGDDTAMRCAVRIPATFTSSSSMIHRFDRLARLGAPLRVPPPPDSRRFVHAYVAAELILHAGRIARPREVLELNCGVDVSLREIAELVLRLRGLEPDEDLAIVEDPALTISDAPRPTSTRTEIPRVRTLDRPHESPWLRSRIRALADEDDADVVAFAQQFCAHLHGTPPLPERAASRQGPRSSLGPKDERSDATALGGGTARAPMGADPR